MEPGARFWEIFFEVYEALPRQGPGDRGSAERALAMCGELSSSPTVLDLGCGVGAQTLQLAELLPGGVITAVDNHEPFIERLREVVRERGLEGRVRPVVGDMGALEFSEGSFDLIWSEGALYNLGLERALEVCRGLVRPGGYLAFTDAVWLKEDPPMEVKAGFDFDYPGMGEVADVLAAIEGAGFGVIGHFTLPDEAWWDDFYGPMERRIEELRGVYGDDPEALGVLDELGKEPEVYRRYGEYFGYEFFVVR